ncbi:MAG: T9SS C-terminal target domain-containing protein [Bacteroidetes bacterium]|nr:MAG: T9SS C-terminal target domain-containing protein [Bacteroidota bacterium]
MKYFINLKKQAHKVIWLSCVFSFLFSFGDLWAQNIFSGEPVQVVGRMQGYNTGSQANSTYRRVSTPSGTPTDGRGQWTKTYNVQSSGGDFTPDNMPGGNTTGFLFISGPSVNRYQNKWVFTGTGQAGLGGYNNVTHQGSTDMGLNMSTTGRYTFVFNDAGYVNSTFYVGYTLNDPITVSRSSQTINANRTVTVGITSSTTPSAGENIFVRYRATTNDFSASTTIVQASGSGTNWTATIPAQSYGTTMYYYVFTSTRTLVQLGGDTDFQRSLSALRYDDNSGNNYNYTLSVPTTIANGLWSNTSTWANGIIPPSGDPAIIAHNVTLDQNPSVSNITINTGQTLTSEAGQARQLTISGTFTNNGTFTANDGKVIFVGSGTTAGSPIAFNNVDINTTGVSLSGETVSGTLQMNGGTVSNPPTYGAASILNYNFAGHVVGNEWTANALSLVGIPNDVIVSENMNFPNFVGYRHLTGILTINSSKILALNGTAGDLSIGGNFTNSGTFTPSGRAVFFRGIGLQQITGATSFDYLILEKTGGSIQLNDNISVTGNTGNVLEFKGTVNVIDTKGKVLTLSGSGGNILLGNNATINNSGSASPASGLLLTGNKTLANGGTSKILNIDNKAGIKILSGATLTANPTGVTTTTLNILTGGGMDIAQAINNTGTTNNFIINFLASSVLITDQPIVAALFNNSSVNFDVVVGINVTYSKSSSGSFSAGALLPSNLASLTINHTGTSPNNVVTLGSNVTVGSLILNTGIFDISARSLTFGNSVNFSVVDGRMRTSTASNLTITTSAGLTLANNLFETSPANLANLTINTGLGIVASLGNQNLSIGGAVTLTSGILNLKGNNILLGTNGQIIENVGAGHIIRDATANTDIAGRGGYIEATGRTVNNASSEIAGLGVFLRASSGSYTDLSVTRFHHTSSNGAGIRLSYLLSGSVAANPTKIGFRAPLVSENPNNLTIDKIFKWNAGVGWSAVNTSVTCFGGGFCTTDDQTSFSVWTVGNGSTPLPVSLLSFEGKVINERAKLTWQTATETNNKQFEIEKSSDAVNFSRIGIVAGSGNSSVIKNYNFTDDNFTSNAYYRLRQVDFSGAENLSQVIFIKNNNDKILIYPNPTKGEIFIQSNENKQNIVSWKVIDGQGKTILNGNDTLENTEKVLSNQLQNQNKGTYIIEIQGNKQVYRQKLVVSE